MRATLADDDDSSSSVVMGSDSGQQSSSKRSKSSQSENFGCYLPDILGYAVIPEKCLISLPATLGISTTNPPHLPSISPTRPIVSLPLGTSSLQDNLAESRTRTVSSLVKHTPSQSLDTLLAAIPVSSSSVSSSNTITTTTTTSLTSEGLPRLACPAKSRVSASASKAPLNKTSGTHTHSKTVFLTCEIKAKVEQAQEGVAREWCYLHNAHQTCGAFIGLVIIRFRLAVCLMLDERTIAMDTTDEDSWGRVEMVAEVSVRVGWGLSMTFALYSLHFTTSLLDGRTGQVADIRPRDRPFSGPRIMINFPISWRMKRRRRRMENRSLIPDGSSYGILVLLPPVSFPIYRSIPLSVDIRFQSRDTRMMRDGGRLGIW